MPNQRLPQPATLVASILEASVLVSVDFTAVVLLLQLLLQHPLQPEVLAVQQQLLLLLQLPLPETMVMAATWEVLQVPQLLRLLPPQLIMMIPTIMMMMT